MKGRARGLGPRSRYRADGTRRRTAGEPAKTEGEPASEGPHSVPATSCSSQPVATPRSAPGRASRLRLEKLGQPIQGWPDWWARGMAVDLATEDATVAGTGSPPTGAAAAAGPTTLDGRTPPEIGSHLKDTEALPTLQRGGARLLRAAAHDSPLNRSTPLRRQRQPG